MDTVNVKQLVEIVGSGLDLVGIGVLVLGALVACLRFGALLILARDASAAYRGLRRDLGKAILLGLELLVAADIIRSVAVAPSLANVLVLGIIVVIRTFLSWSLELEVSGTWPWQRTHVGRMDSATDVTNAVER